MQPPIDNIEEYWTTPENLQGSRMLKHSIVGAPETVRRDLESFVALTKADELMVVCSIHDHPAASDPSSLLPKSPMRDELKQKGETREKSSLLNWRRC